MTESKGRLAKGDKVFIVVEVRLNEGQDRFVEGLAQRYAKSKNLVIQRLLNVGIAVMYERMKIEQEPNAKGRGDASATSTNA